MLEGGIIEPSASEWCLPMVIVKKKDGALRICVDNRKLNSASQVDAYPMPRIDYSWQLISTMDLTWGYWQVPVVSEEEKQVDTEISNKEPQDEEENDEGEKHMDTEIANKEPQDEKEKGKGNQEDPETRDAKDPRMERQAPRIEQSKRHATRRLSAHRSGCTSSR